MKKTISVIKSVFRLSYLYPLLFSLFPIIALYNFNIEYVHYTAILRSINISVVAVLLILIFANLIIRDHARAAVVTTYLVFLFYLYGHLFTWLDTRWSGLVQNRYLTALWVGLLLIGIWFILKKSSKVEDVNKFLSVVSLTLMVVALYNSFSFEIQKLRSNRDNLNSAMALVDEQFSISLEALPDIYYIILDAHTRSDVLQDHFGYDDAEFIKNIEELGFFVADCSQTNYWRTEYSLTSSLNLDYLQDFLEDPSTLPDWKYSVVRQTLDQLDYTTVSFESRATHNVDLGEDILLSKTAKPDIYEDIYPFTNLNEYEVMLVNTTWLQSWLQLLANFQQDLPENMILDAEDAAYFEHYRQTLYILDELQRVPYLESPKFVMAHLLIPHEPFIFNPNGKYEYHPTDEEFVIGYRNNTEFIDNQLPKVLSNIIVRSQVPPIIVIQGDHGPNGTDPPLLLPILNAIYLPGLDNSALYSGITPVNTFRVIFNAAFGSDYELLEDVSYYSQEAEFTNYEQMPVICP